MFNKLIENFKKLPRSLAVVLGLLIITLVLNIGSRILSAAHLQQQTVANELPLVSTTIIKKEAGIEQLTLPGNVKAWHEAIIYARANGYIKNWYVDIGSSVVKGDLLALIETPDLDAQLRQAKADLNTAIAQNKLAQITAKRWRHLVKSESVSQQETDEKVNNAAAMAALVVAAQANVSRLQELVGFERVIAPFTGIINARHTDVGDLINQGSSGTIPLFALSQLNPLRVYVKIPQNYATRITPNMTVQLKFTEYPGQQFPATLIKTAEAIDPKTRTLLAQFKLKNDRNLFLAGSYAQVLFSLDMPPNAVRIPVEALLFQAAGLQIAVVDKSNKVHLRSITISNDFGDQVEVRHGIKPGEKVILYPQDSIASGQEVRVAA